MRRYIKRKVDVLSDVICDICGESCRDKKFGLSNYSTFSADWGYGSSNDMKRWYGEYCEACSGKIKEFIESLGGNVEVKDSFVCT